MRFIRYDFASCGAGNRSSNREVDAPESFTRKMTSNDAQIDVLLRRYAGQSPGNPAAEHLDADELNAFAEGSLPEAARTRYVSHLLDCDNCRQIVSQLAISSGAVVAAEAAPAPVSGYSWWKRLSGFLSPMTLRYAAFAMVLITVAGVVFLVTQRPRESNQLAKTEQTKQVPESAVKPPEIAAPQTGNANQSGGNDNKQLAFSPPASPQSSPSSETQSSPGSEQIAKLDRLEDKPASPPAATKAAKEADPTNNPTLAGNKKAESASETSPSYAPPPPGQRQSAETESREQQNAGSVASGPRKSEQPADKFKAGERGRGGEAGKDIRADDNARLVVNQAPMSKRASDEKAKGPRRDADNSAMNRSSNMVNEDAVKTQGVTAAKPAAAEEKPPETRSAGGRKFKRQGSAWVDTKFKSSMTLKSISRGSSEFDALDSGIRSIAQQLGGEVIVVWKGKAYVIK